MTNNRCGQKRQIDYNAVITAATNDPTLTQVALAKLYGCNQTAIGKVLRGAGLTRVRGRKPQRPERVADKWERILHDEGLGMDSGLSKWIYYGQDYDRI
jgi:hypothetical protein